jgi:hypothetical protein
MFVKALRNQVIRCEYGKRIGRSAKVVVSFGDICVEQKNGDIQVVERFIVTSWNEWDPLREVLVGSAARASFQPADPGCWPQVRGILSVSVSCPNGPKPRDTTEGPRRNWLGSVRCGIPRGSPSGAWKPSDFSRG